MGPELIGAYSVILNILYARNGDMPRDDRHLAGVLGCSKRKAKALTEGLIDLGKIEIQGGKVLNKTAVQVLFERKNQPKPMRKVGENGPDPNENSSLGGPIREDKNNPPNPPERGARKIGVPENVKMLVGGKQ